MQNSRTCELGTPGNWNVRTTWPRPSASWDMSELKSQGSYQSYFELKLIFKMNFSFTQ